MGEGGATKAYIYRSEGLPERDIESLGVMGWGLAAAENSSAAAVAVAVAAVAVAPQRGGRSYWLRSGLAALRIGCAQDWLRSGLAALIIVTESCS